MSVLNLFPARIRFVNPDGTLTSEALRMLDVLVARVGGAMGDVGTDVFAMPEPAAAGAQDVVQQPPAGDGLAELVLQPTSGDGSLGDIVQQAPDYSAGTALGLVDYRFYLRDTAVAPDTYGDATHVARLTVDQQGRITGAESVLIDFPTPSGADYSGSLTGKTVVISNGIITSVT